MLIIGHSLNGSPNVSGLFFYSFNELDRENIYKPINNQNIGSLLLITTCLVIK